MTDYNAMNLDELYGELETRWFDSIHEADEMEREAQRRSAVVTALCHLAADLDAEGLVVVPREATLMMAHRGYYDHEPSPVDARNSCADIYRIMVEYAPLPIAAAPLAPEVG
ncbi:hypothetical protein ACN6KF_003032 [Labrys sp. La1]|uniref:hypothetical protein n=1 Tax=Labrys sp. La1 TaxID=3404917 RepID=UPI003EBFA3BF